MRRLAIALLFIFMTHLCYGQFAFPSLGGSTAAMGGCSVGLSHADAALQNYAALTTQEQCFISIAYRQDFLVLGTGYKYIGASMPIRHTGNAFATYCHYGDVIYNEQMATLGYAQRITQRLSLAVGGHYLFSGTSDGFYTPQHLITASLAFFMQFDEQWQMGAKIFNPFCVKLNTKSISRVPAILNIGVGYHPHPSLLLSAEIEKDIAYEPNLRAGAEYTFFEHFAIRAGFATGFVYYTFGIGYTSSRVHIDFATEVHQALGLCPALNCTFAF